MTTALMEIAATRREKMKAPELTGVSAKRRDVPDVRSRATTVAADAPAIITP